MSIGGGSELCGQLARSPDIVIIAESQPRAPCHLCPVIASGAHARWTVVADDANAAVLELGHDRADVLSRSVIHDNHFEVHVALRQDCA
jgi:hypothetical protein